MHSAAVFCNTAQIEQPTLVHVETQFEAHKIFNVDFLWTDIPVAPDIKWNEDRHTLTLSFQGAFASWLPLNQYKHHDVLELIALDPESSRIVLQLNRKVTYTTHFEGRHFIVRFDKDEKKKLRELPKRDLQAGAQHPMEQEKLMSVKVKDAPLREVLSQVAAHGQMNIILSTGIHGKVTLDILDRPWNQLFDLILASHRLIKKEVNKTTFVMTYAEAMTWEHPEELLLQMSAVGKITEVLPLNYAKVEHISDIIQAKKMQLLSKEGALSFDHRTNALVIHDRPAKVSQIKKLVSELDVPIQQVVIEARVVTMRDHVAKDLGVRWGYSSSSSHHKTSGSLEALHPDSDGTTLEDTLNFNGPALPHHGTPFKVGLQWHKLAGNRLIDLELSALEQEQKVEILASPSITTVNHQTASIEQGTEIPYVESASSGATSVVFKKAALSLEVTPQILPQQQILLDLKVKQDHQGDTVTTSTGQAVAIDMQRMSSKILLKNQETLVIGGIYQTKYLTSVRKVPWLGSLPYIGFLFRSTEVFSERQEILIFVTPKMT